jgi:hypothetical protein
MSTKHILLIAGMHRSGTSALCAALEQCGASFGSNLLSPMAGVNEDGFWEDADLVALNQALLQRLGGTWYALPAGLQNVDWAADTFADLREQVDGLLGRDVSPARLQALKDPRLCLTLPFWLGACDRLGLPATVCRVNRAPLEIARSLQKRDGFPLGYGLRLCSAYRALLAASTPAGSLEVTYDALVQDPEGVLRALVGALPLDLPADGLAGAVRPGLRHHQLAHEPVLGDPGVAQAALDEAIARQYPNGELAAEFSRCLVERGEQLTRLGEEHAGALATLKQRDRDIEDLSALHREALATINERDAQIVEFDRRLTETGEHLGRALDTLRERDEQLQRLMAIPVVGHVLRFARWIHARR